MLAQFLPPMLARSRGRVLNVALIAAFQPIAWLATEATTLASRATPKWLLRRLSGKLVRGLG